ncbi:MAG: Unknown protein [uncultured Aureispira sp.]|uniref:Uncharacterized protein n=1 Tax=uncultured Aureispira sp. TaxID=1331704 RepID=A0A6S6SF82_9BACT|nr:MAG: Unknown protein [uncultured Aureispira sp.]
MFQYIEKVLAKNTFQFQIKQADLLLTFEQVILLWKTSKDFRLFYTQMLREVPFAAFFWENQAITNATLQQNYTFVIVGTTAFNGKKPNPKPFQAYFLAQKEIVCFPNLDKTARLIVPSPNSVKETYTHLGNFIRNAPYRQIDAFWEQIGLEMEQGISEQPLWLSTSGLGVYWLHARLDQRPKYYTHAPYKNL